MLRNIIEKELENCLKTREDLFLIDLDISPDNSIKILIDVDNGVTLEDCIYVSRSIEHNLDRDEYDFIDSLALKNGKLMGLGLDYDNCDDDECELLMINWLDEIMDSFE